MSTQVVEVREASKTYRRGGQVFEALVDVGFVVEAGRTLAIVGESGAGKSTLARLITGLERPTAGTVLIDGSPLRLRAGRPSPVQMVFQHPTDALNARWSIGRSIAEPLGRTPRERRQAVIADALQQVGLDPERQRQRPAAFSGGQLQRVGLARALAASPRVLVCDEPTSALDVSVQAQIVNLLMAAQRDRGFACVLITHDLAVARSMAHDVLVLKDGRAVEHTAAADFFAGPTHPYARSLLELAAAQNTSQEAAPAEGLPASPHA